MDDVTGRPPAASRRSAPRLRVVPGDITLLAVDAIVNAANSSLLGGGGVDGAIHRAAGPRLLAACRELRAASLPEGLPPGQAVATPGFDLPARWVIHTVGPNRHAGETDPGVLESCFRSSLRVAAEIGARSVAFPAIGAGAYGWPPSAVAAAARRAILPIDEDGAGSAGARTAQVWPEVDEVLFVAVNTPVREAFESEFADAL
jgi:O-acetyl-ADP-ribose deacetylase (regulator of RNase III)